MTSVSVISDRRRTVGKACSVVYNVFSIQISSLPSLSALVICLEQLKRLIALTVCQHIAQEETSDHEPVFIVASNR